MSFTACTSSVALHRLLPWRKTKARPWGEEQVVYKEYGRFSNSKRFRK
jgi:hypothetical protein